MGTVHEAIAAVIAEMPAIGKDSYNAQQGFKFRGIDAVVSALKPLIAKHGIVIAPDVEERLYEQRPTRSGSVMHTVHLHVRYRVYGPDGEPIECSTWGEGTDSGDKATNKAMTGAYKYLLFQLFAIADSDEDGDANTPEDTAPTSQQVARDALHSGNGGGGASDPQLGKITSLFIEKGFPNDKDIRHAYIEAVIGHAFDKPSELSKAEASAVIEALAAESPSPTQESDS